MAKRNSVPPKSIVTALRQHLGQRTVLFVAVPVLDEQIGALEAGRPPRGVTEKAIVQAFRGLAKAFGHSDYHPTYVQRPLGPRGFLEIDRDRFRFRAPLLAGMTVEGLNTLRDDLLQSLRSAHERRRLVMKRLEDTMATPLADVERRRALVAEYLGQIVGNGGEMLEVVSFAVLQEYFRSFGFSLQRFSTTRANDGGMDFVADDAIYQVTTDQSLSKLRKDLAKSPGTKRVLIRPALSNETLRMDEAEVLETIEINDLLQHFVAWLLDRDVRRSEAHHLQRVLHTALNEFRRENRAESASA